MYQWLEYMKDGKDDGAHPSALGDKCHAGVALRRCLLTKSALNWQRNVSKEVIVEEQHWTGREGEVKSEAKYCRWNYPKTVGNKGNKEK